MTKEETLLNNKIHELEQEMKNKGLWQKEAPDWVNYLFDSTQGCIVISGINPISTIAFPPRRDTLGNHKSAQLFIR